MGNCSNTYSKGSRTGRIIEITYSGCVWKTWEIEMVCDGLKPQRLKDIKGNPIGMAAVANTWTFSIDANAACGENVDEIVKQLRNKLRLDEPVTINYWSPYIAGPWRGNSNFFVIDLE